MGRIRLPKGSTLQEFDRVWEMVGPELQAEIEADLQAMQTPEARRATQAAFDATPEELGQAAFEAAQRKRTAK